MKFLDIINGSIKKFGKGILAIFIIKLLLFGGVFVIQSCQTDNELFENQEQKLALEKFENLVRTSTPKIEKALIENEETLSKGNNQSSENQKEKEMIKLIKPIVDGSKELLYAYDFTDKDLIEGFQNSEDPTIAIIGLAILSSERKNNFSSNNLKFSNIFIHTANAQVGKCAMKALGIEDISDFKNWKKMKKKARKKLVKKVATKVASRIGGLYVSVGFMLFEFAMCMW